MNKSRTSNDELRGKLIVLSGPSGTGKGTIISELLKRRNADLSVSCTTRAPRPGEVDGESYFFVSPEEFDRMSAEGGFLESADVFGHKYGTPREAVEQKLAQGRDVILEIDVQGAQQVKASFPEARLIFISPPSLQTLKERLETRGTETAEELEVRTSKAAEEMSHAQEYDFCVVNDDLGRAIDEIDTYLAGV